MASIISIHNEDPQQRLLDQVATVIGQGGVIAYPTDSGYALGCQVGDKKAAERIRRIRQLGKRHNFTLMCRDLSEIAVYAKINNPIFRYLKAHTPGPYTFILPATKAVPRRLLHPNRKTIGIRISAHRITHQLLMTLQSAMMSVSLILPEQEETMHEVDEIIDEVGALVDMVVNGGDVYNESTTIIDLTSGEPTIIRHGQGDDSDL